MVEQPAVNENAAPDGNVGMNSLG